MYEQEKVRLLQCLQGIIKEMAQPTLRNLKGGLRYNESYEKQVYNSFPNFLRKNFVQYYGIFV